MLTELVEEFQRLQNDNQDSITKETILDLAVKYDYLTGKWMLFVPNKKVDEVWQRLGKAILDHKIPQVLYMTMTATDDSPDRPNNHKTKISVVTPRFPQSI